jgi:hypothetical protein
VRLMTSIARHSLRVRDGIDLRKPFRFCSVFFMTAAAEVDDVRQLGNIAAFSLDMFGLGTVTGLAGHSLVLSRIMNFGFCVVAESALASSRIGDRRGGNHVQRSRPVVAIFPKIFGDHGGAHDEEDHNSSQKDQRGTNQVSRIPEKATQGHPQNLKRNSCPHEREAGSLRRQVCGSLGNMETKRQARLRDLLSECVGSLLKISPSL